LVPLGTELKYTSSCKYDSQSIEISSQKDYRRSLKEESKFNAKIGVSGQFQRDKIAAKIETEVAWGESEKFQRFVTGSESENTVTFEARAICSEFEASFNPYAEQVLDKVFKKAMNALPEPYDPSNPTHEKAYSEFISAYGTHYVRQVVLGAKRIYSTSMTSRDLTKLTREQVDVSATLSIDVQLAIGSPKYVKDALSTGNAPTVVNNNNFFAAPDPDGKDVEPGGTLQTSYDDFSATSRQSENAQKISEKKIVTSEVNIGGLPDVDWRAWAASVKEKPMPISYELVGLWELMIGESRVDAFFDALLDIENIDLKTLDGNTALDAMHFGVASGSGEPLSSYSLNPNAEYRALLEVGEIPKFETGSGVGAAEEVQTLDIFKSGHGGNWAAGPTYGPLKHYACGAAVRVDPHGAPNADDDHSIMEIHLRFCSVDGTESSPQEVNLGVENLMAKQSWHPKDCPKGQFINGARVRYCGEGDLGGMDCKQNPGGVTTDLLGLTSLEISCNWLGGGPRTQTKWEVYCTNKDDTNNKCDNENTWRPWQYLGKTTDPANTAYAISGGSVQQGSSLTKSIDGKDDTGIEGLQVTYEEAVLPNPEDPTKAGPSVDIVTYTATWKTKIDRPTPIFVQTIRGDVGKNKEEEENQFGFTERTEGNFKLNYVNNVPFGVSPDFSSAGTIGMTNFGKSLQESNLQSFSFLSVDNMDENEGKLLGGVVHHTGLIASQRPGVAAGFQVEKIAAHEFVVTMNGKAAVDDPTVIVFPQFYTNNGATFPENIGDVTVALHGNDGVEPVDTKQFSVKAGAGYAPLGFNFLAVSRDLKNPSVKHGYVHGVPRDNDDLYYPPHRLDGINVPDISYFKESTTVDVLVGQRGGIRLHFSTPFDAVPAVVATPVIGAINGGDCWQFTDTTTAVPRCIVESITSESCFVKCGCIESGDGASYLYTPLPFNIVAVGPAQ
jgi:hypothetical protein